MLYESVQIEHIQENHEKNMYYARFKHQKLYQKELNFSKEQGWMPTQIKYRGLPCFWCLHI